MRATQSSAHMWDTKETTMLTLSLRYARYALVALSSVGFGLAQN